ncbi:unnamed protein product [Cylindrotheca closterium]|uniref:Uncharacterized protein n=1 Tax=Cylindrotheca closterium TaxID=2856 RepID=A0AAD2FEI3_9STRA|nr:unnamed protein product [Cylindrotheca closterium]
MPRRKTSIQKNANKRGRLTSINERRPLTDHVDDYDEHKDNDDEDAELAKRRQQFFFQALRRGIRDLKVGKKPAAKKRIYKRTLRMRPCAKQGLFWGPILILVLEWYLGYVLRAEHVTDAYYDQYGYEPWMIDKPARIPIDIQNLTTIGTNSIRSQNMQQSCRGDLRWTANHHNPWYHYARPSRRQIPAMIHQTNKDRCLTMNFARASQKWSAFSHNKWSYYLHDESALAQLFLEMQYPEFPYLRLVVQNCLLYLPPVEKNLWSYLVLWVYGGVVADVNSMPDNFHFQTLQKDDDAIFIFDAASQRMNTTFMASSPKHPVMYYAIQHTLLRILTAENIASPDLVYQTGPEALQKALEQFSREDDEEQDWSRSLPRMVKGVEDQEGRSAKVISSEEKYATPIFISPAGKVKEFGKMGVQVDVIQPVRGPAGGCFSQMHSNLDKAVGGGHNGP